jgi:hypothetical protein
MANLLFGLETEYAVAGLRPAGPIEPQEILGHLWRFAIGHTVPPGAGHPSVALIAGLTLRDAGASRSRTCGREGRVSRYTGRESAFPDRSGGNRAPAGIAKRTPRARCD